MHKKSVRYYPIILSCLMVAGARVELFTGRGTFRASMLRTLRGSNIALFPCSDVCRCIGAFGGSGGILLYGGGIGDHLIDGVPTSAQVLSRRGLALLPGTAGGPIRIRGRHVTRVESKITIAGFVC